ISRADFLDGALLARRRHAGGRLRPRIGARRLVVAPRARRAPVCGHEPDARRPPPVHQPLRLLAAATPFALGLRTLRPWTERRHVVLARLGAHPARDRRLGMDRPPSEARAAPLASLLRSRRRRAQSPDVRRIGLALGTPAAAGLRRVSMADAPAGHAGD